MYIFANMIKNNYRVLGVMSGTSLDGIDLVYVSFHLNKTWEFKILKAETMLYTEQWKNVLKDLVAFSLEELKAIDVDYTAYLATVISDFMSKHNIEGVDAVCSHGHTALHQPENKLTYQIGNRKELASLIKETVVCDFRVQDVMLGGQGAPLVPIGDELLFSEFDYCINFGGFANISSRIGNDRVAYDICPVNIVLNHYVKTLGLDYDDEGKVSKSGKVNDHLLEELNSLSFYKIEPPKSLGLEWVQKNVFPLINAHKLKVEDVLRTFVEHVAIQVSNVIKEKPSGSVFITGGGAYNKFLIERIKVLNRNKIVIPQRDIIEFKEALIFGFLGILKLRNEINCLQSVTGASKNHSTGVIFTP